MASTTTTKDKKSISDTVYDYLTDMVLSQKIAIGEKISEEKIASKLNCSRAPIREALKKLSTDGIVTLYPRRFAEVTQYDSEQIKQIGVTRVFLDATAIKLAVLYGSRADFLHMKTLAKDCYEAAIHDDIANRIKSDIAFHLELYQIGKNEQMLEMATQLFKRIEFIQICIYSHVIDPKKQLDEHLQIVNYLIEGQEKDARDFLIKHDANFHSLNDEYPESFFHFD